MRKRQPLFPALILALVTGAVDARGAQDLEDWRSLRTEHFDVVGDADENELREVARRLEEFRAGYLRVESRPEDGASDRTMVVVFADDRSFTPYKPVDAEGRPLRVGGLFLGTGDDGTIVLTTEDGAERSAYHEYVHRVGADRARRPLWLEEGLAEFYSTLQVRNGGRVVRTGLPIHSNLSTLRENALIGLDVLLEVEGDSAYYRGPGQALFYAQSWAWTHYLLLKRPGGKAQLDEFIRRGEEGLDLAARFHAAFHTDFETMLGELATYTTDSLTFPIIDYALDRRIVIQDNWESRELPPSEALYHLSEILTRVGRTADARRYLEDAIAADPSIQIDAGQDGAGIDVRGYLDGLECRPDGVHLSIETEGGLLRFSPAAAPALEIISVDPGIRDSIECGLFPRRRRVLVRYTPDPGPDGSGGTPGRIIILPE